MKLTRLQLGRSRETAERPETATIATSGVWLQLGRSRETAESSSKKSSTEPKACRFN